MSSDDEPDMLDPSRSEFIAIFGRKGSGKSVRAQTIFDAWPGPRMVIDVLGTIAPLGPDGKPVRPTRNLDGGWPRDERGELAPVVWFIPDIGSPTFLEDVDNAQGLCYELGGVLVWSDEAHLLYPVDMQEKMPCTRRALIAGRHRNLSEMFLGPRPREINTLILGQADHVLTYDVPLKQDREHIANTAGWDRDDFHQHHGQLRKFEYLWYNAREHRLTHYDPVPLPRRRPQ